MLLSPAWTDGRIDRVIALLFALSLITASTLPASASVGANHPASSAAVPIAFTLNDKGLASLSYGDWNLLASPSKGNLSAVNNTPKLQAADGTITVGTDKPITSVLDAAKAKVTETYPWGVLTARYTQDRDRLNVDLTAHNSSKDTTISALEVQFAELVFPSIPNGGTLDAGMFGTGVMHPLHQYPLNALARQMPLLIMVDYGTGTLAFCSDDPPTPNAPAIQIPWSSNHPTNTMYPFRTSIPALKPGASASVHLSLRFGPGGSTATTLARDVIDRYRKTYPFQLRWRDHRPIGALFLAASEAHPATNPRGWFNNAKDVDITTPQGLTRFRDRVLAYADDSIKVIKDVGGQGMITWDPEGEEYSNQTYYGDPRLSPQLAPELEQKLPNGMTLIDEYFKKFRDAGLRVGVCIRPQQIKFVNGAPVQGDATNEAAAAILKDKLAYARTRWGCSLFYVDSTVDKTGSLDPAVFKNVADAFPDVLLMPENESLRNYAYTAPLNSFMHHGVTSTPAGARLVYPSAFSVLLASSGDFVGKHDALVQGVRRGDILIFNGWYEYPVLQQIKSIYAEAKSAGITR